MNSDCFPQLAEHRRLFPALFHAECISSFERRNGELFRQTEIANTAMRLIMGRASAEKIIPLIRDAKEETECPQIFMVPDQMSYETDFLLCEQGGPKMSRNTEVLTFARFAEKVLSELGGYAKAVLDAGGRLLLMHRALTLTADELTVYQRPSKNPAFYVSVLQTVNELKRCCITEKNLREAAAQMGEKGSKLNDLALVMNAYDSLTSQVAMDPNDRLSLAEEKLRDGAWLRGRNFYFAGFQDFTAQQWMILEEIIQFAGNVEIALDCADYQHPERESGIFEASASTASRLIQIAGKAKVPVTVENIAEPAPERDRHLVALDRNLFAEEPEEQKAEGTVRFQIAGTQRTELEMTAAEIRKLVYSGFCRYRDVVVAFRSLSGKEDLIENVFQSYEVPLYLSRKTDILRKPVLTVVLAALDCINGGYRYEDMFRYLKTGLTTVTREECDLLENYVLLWKIRGSGWTKNVPWNMPPRGYGNPVTSADEEQLSLLETIRAKAIGPLERLKNQKDQTGRGQTLALYEFLKEIGLRKKIQSRSDAMKSSGELTKAEEERQLWDILCGAMEQCAAVLGDEPMDLRSFARLFELILTQYDVSAIPVAVDRVTAGEMTRIENRRCKVLFLLDADDSQIPMVSQEPGVLSDEERLVLEEIGLHPARRMQEKIQLEMTAVYKTCVQPSKRLYVCWAKFSEDGTENRPAFVVARLRRIFPDAVTTEENESADYCLTAEKPALIRAGFDRSLREKMRKSPFFTDLTAPLDRAEHWSKRALNYETARKLYGENLPMSASRMDKFNQCHFAYFMKFGIRAEPRQEGGFHAPEYGTYVHYVLENVLKEAKENGGVKNTTDEQLKKYTEQVTAQYEQENLKGLENETPRFRYLFNRLKKTVWLIVQNAAEELRRSDFEPLAFEFAFGGREPEMAEIEHEKNGVAIHLSGKVDRVDGWIHNNRLYLRVVDYKTGKKSFDLTEIEAGIGLQMLLYLFALQDQGETYFGRETVGAGVLYLPALDQTVEAKSRVSREEKQDLLDKQLKRKGLLLYDEEVLKAMESEDDETFRFIPVKLQKDGRCTGSLATAEKFGALRKHTERILDEICEELGQSNITADPFWRNENDNACRFCDFKEACHFEDGRFGDGKRVYRKLKEEEFWQKIAAGGRTGGERTDED